MLRPPVPKHCSDIPNHFWKLLRPTVGFQSPFSHWALQAQTSFHSKGVLSKHLDVVGSLHLGWGEARAHSLLKDQVLSHSELVHKFYFRGQIVVVILNLHFPAHLPFLDMLHAVPDEHIKIPQSQRARDCLWIFICYHCHNVCNSSG